MMRELDIYENLKSGYYCIDNHLSLPCKEDYKVYYVYKSGKCLASGAKKDILYIQNTQYTSSIDLAQNGFTTNSELDEVLYKSDTDTYRNKKASLQKEFTDDAIYRAGLTDHPRAYKAFDFAWDIGHGSGYLEVLNYLFDIANVLIGD